MPDNIYAALGDLRERMGAVTADVKNLTLIVARLDSKMDAYQAMNAKAHRDADDRIGLLALQLGAKQAEANVRHRIVTGIVGFVGVVAGGLSDFVAHWWWGKL